MTQLTLVNGTKELIANGVVIINAHEPTTIKLGQGTEQITIIIKFADTEDKQLKKTAKGIDKTTLEVEFLNYVNVFGHYTKEYWQIGQINNRVLYWSYSITGVNEGVMKKVEFSFFVGEEVSNG